MRVLIAGGGTGGHLFPGIAIAEEVVTRHAANSVLFVGTAKGLEARVVPEEGYQLELVDVAGLKRVGPLAFLSALSLLPRAFLASMRILKRFDPDVVVGVGGYASGPVVLAAWLKRIPTAIQEQNALPGFTNRVLGHFVRAIFIAFDEARAHFPKKKCHLTGNPIRRAFLDNYLKPRSLAPTTDLTLLVTGGSRGAHVLNERVVAAIGKLAELKDRLVVIHQTGEKDVASITEAYRALGVRAEVSAFIRDMSSAYARVDLVVCRSGATTLAELTMCKKAALLVPFPFATDDHQAVNAKAMVDAGAALMIREEALTPERLADEVRALLGDDERRRKMERASGLLGRPEAGKEIADVCVALCSERLLREGRNLPPQKPKPGQKGGG